MRNIVRPTSLERLNLQPGSTPNSDHAYYHSWHHTAFLISITFFQVQPQLMVQPFPASNYQPPSHSIVNQHLVAQPTQTPGSACT